MSSEADIFKAVASYWFSSPPYSGDDERILDFLEQAKSFTRAYQYHNLTKPGSPMPHLGLVDHPKLNACAYKLGINEGVAFPSGCVDVLEEFFNTILAHPKTFPLVGNPTSEIEPATAYQMSCERSGCDLVVPIDDRRRKLARALTRNALNALTVHELAHFRLGHNRYRTNPTGNVALFEWASSDRTTLDDVLEAQACEMNADALAVSEGLHLITAQSSNAADRKSALSDLFSWWLYAVCALFRLLARDIPFKLEDLGVERHPPARVRLMWTLQTVIPMAGQSHFELPEAEVRRIVDITVAQIESDIATITGRPVDAAGLSSSVDPAVDCHLERVKLKYYEIMPLLAQVSYTTIEIRN